MSLRKDKEKVLGETFDDARIATFLDYPAPAGVNADYHLLEKAYRGMLGGNFATFVKQFIEAGKDQSQILSDFKIHLTVKGFEAVQGEVKPVTPQPGTPAQGTAK